MSLYGYVTKADLSKSGHFLGMSALGVALAGIVAIVLASTAVQFAFSVMAVIALVGLTAWDTQRINEIYLKRDHGEAMSRTALIGAVALYFDANPVALLVRVDDLLANKRNE